MKRKIMSKQLVQFLHDAPLLWLLLNGVAVPLAGFVQYYVFGIIFLFTLDASVYGSVLEADVLWQGLAYTSIGGAIVGVILALAQSLALLHTPVSKWRWVASTIAALVVSNGMLFVGFWLVSAYARSVSVRMAYTFADSAALNIFLFFAIMVIPGIVQSVVVGALQWWALKSSFYGYEGKRWIWATGIGWSIWFLLPILGFNVLGRFIAHDGINTAIVLVVASLPYVAITTRTLRQILDLNLPFYAVQGYQSSVNSHP